MTKTTSEFDFPGLPAVIEELVRLIKAPDVSVALSPVLFEAKRYLAAIPDMLAEIDRLRKVSAASNASCGILQLTIDNIMRGHVKELDRLRSLNAEMREAAREAILMMAVGHDPDECDICKAAENLRAILSKTETEQP